MMLNLISRKALLLSALVFVSFSSIAFTQKSSPVLVEVDVGIIKLNLPKNLELLPFQGDIPDPWEFKSKKLRVHVRSGFYAGQDPLEKQIMKGYSEKSVTIDGIGAVQASYLLTEPRKIKYRYITILYFEEFDGCPSKIRVAALYKSKNQEPDIERIFNSITFDKKRLACPLK